MDNNIGLQAQARLTPFFSIASASMLQQRLPGPEALLEEWLARTPDEALNELVYFLHDWAVSNKENGFYQLGRYFDQDKDEIDSAAALFAKRRQEICATSEGNSKAWPMLQLYFLYDCLIHVGSQKRNERTMGYLDDPPQPLTYHSINDILQDRERYGRPYNYVVVGGELRIKNKTWYHSELADGRAIEAAGELAIITDETGNPMIVINHMSGHYRPPAYTAQKAVQAINTALENTYKANDNRPQIILCSEFLRSEKIRNLQGSHQPQPDMQI